MVDIGGRRAMLSQTFEYPFNNPSDGVEDELSRSSTTEGDVGGSARPGPGRSKAMGYGPAADPRARVWCLSPAQQVFREQPIRWFRTNDTLHVRPQVGMSDAPGIGAGRLDTSRQPG